MALIGPAMVLALAGCQSAGGISPNAGTATALPTDFNPVVTDPLAAEGEIDPNVPGSLDKESDGTIVFKVRGWRLAGQHRTRFVR